MAREHERDEPRDPRRHPVVVDEDDVGRLRQGGHVVEDLVGRAGDQLDDVLVADGVPRSSLK